MMAINTAITSKICLLQLLEVNFVLFLTYTIGHRKDFQDILLVIMVGVSDFDFSMSGFACSITGIR